MFVLFIILNEVSCLEDILSGFVQEGIRGGTIIDSQGMGSRLASMSNDDIPIFGTLRMMLGETHPYSKTIFTVLENQEMVDKAVKVVQNTVTSCTDNGQGFMFTVPIANTYRICGDEE